jgi:thiosulfate dehydrogenase (quinone) large subunit
VQLTHPLARTALPTAGVGPLVAGLLAFQAFLGYEWLMSGLSKVLAGDFPSSLGGTLADMTRDQTGWYKSFVDGIVIPNGTLFGYAVMFGELCVGTVFVATALVAFVRWSPRLLAVVAVFAIAGAFMSLNFHLAMGVQPPWVVSPNPNDQGVDLDSLMVILQVALAVVSVSYLVRARNHSQA